MAFVLRLMEYEQLVGVALDLSLALNLWEFRHTGYLTQP